jgi:hypothetical protein
VVAFAASLFLARQCGTKFIANGAFLFNGISILKFLHKSGNGKARTYGDKTSLNALVDIDQIAGNLHSEYIAQRYFDLQTKQRQLLRTRL